ncbi:MAG TPA: proteasome subunit beta [Candidatus Nitrosotalea sp.]|nr:proteasome subunit beta [Candidatus Nitrosotalea sp.]
MPGATAVGIVYDGGVVMASERRVSYGNFIVSKNTKKTFQITDFVGACCAGMVADMQVLAMQMRALTKIRKLELKREIPPNSVAKMMSSLMYERRFYPLLTQVIVGGVDGNPAVYTLDPLGSVLPDDYAAVGTGAEMALGVLDQEYKKELKEKEAISLAVKSIKSAIMRDAASGEGIDVLVADKNGIREFTEN